MTWRDLPPHAEPAVVATRSALSAQPGLASWVASGGYFSGVESVGGGAMGPGHRIA